MRLIALLFILNGFIPAFGQLPDLYQNGLVALELGKTNESIEHFNKCIKEGIKPGKSLYFRSCAYLLNKDYETAESGFLKALKYNVDESALELARLYSIQGKAKQSVTYLEKYILLCPDKNPESVIKLKDFEPIHKSDDWYNYISEFKPEGKWEWINETQFLINRKEFKAAHDKVDNAFKHYPDDANLHVLKSKIYHSEGNMPLANYEMSLAIKSSASGNPEILYEAYNLAKESHKFDKACSYLNMAKNLTPENFNLGLLLAESYMLSEQYQLAKDEIEAFIKLFPNNKQAIYLQAEIYYLGGQSTSSLKVINQLFKEEIIQPDWYLLRGKTYLASNILKYAAEDLAMYLDLDPNSLDANYYLGLTFRKMGNKDKACYYFTRAYKLGDDRPLTYIKENCID